MNTDQGKENATQKETLAVLNDIFNELRAPARQAEPKFTLLLYGSRLIRFNAIEFPRRNGAGRVGQRRRGGCIGRPSAAVGQVG